MYFSIPELYPPQVEVSTRLAMMKFKLSPLNPSSILFLHPTGGVKYLVRDAHSVLFRGVSLMVVPVLSLGVNLSEKVRQKVSQGCERVILIHISSIYFWTSLNTIIFDNMGELGEQKYLYVFKTSPIISF